MNMTPLGKLYNLFEQKEITVIEHNIRTVWQCDFVALLYPNKFVSQKIPCLMIAIGCINFVQLFYFTLKRVFLLYYIYYLTAFRIQKDRSQESRDIDSFK